MRNSKIMSVMKRTVISVLLFCSLIVFVSAGAVSASQPRDIIQSNVRSNTFTLSWRTDVIETARINYGTTTDLGSTAYDDRGQDYEGITHYVSISNLSANTTYYYDIISGDATIDNGGAHYTITTGPILPLPGGTDLVYGEVFLNDGITRAEGTIVYITLRDNDTRGTPGDSQVSSCLVDGSGYWYFVLKNVRTQAKDAYFDYSAAGDNLILDAEGPDGGIALQIVDTSEDTPASAMTLSQGYWSLNMTEMNWYQNIAPYNSTGAASCQMILNYIRAGAGAQLLTQDEIYEYGKSGQPLGSELTPQQADRALGHFDPYDSLVSNSYDIYDTIIDGNPYQGYNYSIDIYNPGSDPAAVNKYMRDICHWMAYAVTKEEWWKAGELVARPNTPALIPLYGTYNHWVAVKGFVASENPCPQPQTNPWYTPDFTVHGFWMKDPLVTGIGQNSYKTASECESIYYLPLQTGDRYDGLFLQVAEPPAEISDADVIVAQPASDLANLNYIGVRNYTEDSGGKIMAAAMARGGISTAEKKSILKKKGWRDMVAPGLLSDLEAITAFEGARMGKPIFVKREDIEGADYYLAPFDKRVKRGFLTSAVIVLDAKEGFFKEASWTNPPEKFLKVDKAKALNLIRAYLLRNMQKEIKNLSRRPIREKNDLLRSIIATYTKLLSYMGRAESILVWAPNTYSPSVYQPYWKVDMNGYIWYVTQEGDVIPETELKAILDELEKNSILMKRLLNAKGK